ncbi:MAG: addiction module toxin RelE [Nanoarchaeota archaeon]
MDYEIHPALDKILHILSKKDRNQLDKILKKIDEIIRSEKINHYKNLRKPLQDYKRVHIGHFVLLFNLRENKIVFRYYDHHDKVYKWRP